MSSGLRRNGLTGFAARAACAAWLLAASPGCMIILEDHGLETQFTDDQVATIRDGATTRREAFERLGAPACVVRTVAGAEPDAAPPADADAETARLLERFVAAGLSGPGQVGYGYRNTAVGWSDFCAYGQGGGGCISSVPLRRDRLLRIVVDAESGLVVGHGLSETEWKAHGKAVSPWLR